VFSFDSRSKPFIRCIKRSLRAEMVDPNAPDLPSILGSEPDRVPMMYRSKSKPPQKPVRKSKSRKP
jgi:hypothetical protein